VKSRREKNFLAILALAIVLLVLSCLGFLPGFDVLGFLLTGWAFFIQRVFPQVRVRWDAVISFVVYAVLLIAGSHLFLSWLYRQMGAGKWHKRWTLSGFCLVILMFAAGIAMIGVVHQTTWLVRSPLPIYRYTGGAYEGVRRIKCESNLRQIGEAMDRYATDHDGMYPDDFAELFLSDGLSAQIFVCPSGDDIPAAGINPREIAENLKKPGCCSYLYFARGLRAPLDPACVLATEPLQNHVGGINVLYGDGHVDWAGPKEAEELLRKLGVVAAATQPG
jgi:prepilin-type processing-associated H-X9-DG protein